MESEVAALLEAAGAANSAAVEQAEQALVAKVSLHTEFLLGFLGWPCLRPLQGPYGQVVYSEAALPS